VSDDQEATGNTIFGSPTHDELCKAAYRLWEERGCPEGSPDVDWQRAEKELGTSERPSKA
jgi:Protein of unknown function (DUF2934)